MTDPALHPDIAGMTGAHVSRGDDHGRARHGDRVAGRSVMALSMVFGVLNAVCLAHEGENEAKTRPEKRYKTARHQA